MRYDRKTILEGIQQTAKENDGIPLGRMAFARITGIAEADWRGVYWARWGDAVKEAGFSPNTSQTRFQEPQFLDGMVQAIRHFGRLPSTMDIRIYRRSNPSFPSHSTILKHYRSMGALFERLFAHAKSIPGLEDIAKLCESFAKQDSIQVQVRTPEGEGFVYLIKSGAHYKIGKSSDLERRIKEIRIALPEAATLVHVVKTDDADGIEAYWHRRFADRRANGEWFALSAIDVAAFKRRKFQ